MKKIIAYLAIVVLLLVPVSAGAQQKGDVVILYENDVHCALHGYPAMAGLRDKLRQMGCHTAVVSAGDFSFGGAMGTASKGGFIIRLMNAVGYDAVCLGNHEFDMGLPRLYQMDSMLHAPMLCCNFRNSLTGQVPMLSYVMRHYGDYKVAFIGVTTPNTVASTSPVHFQDENGKFIYNFSPNNLAATVQPWVTAARAAGADYVILLSHMGDEEGEQTSTSLIPQLSGVDAILDGHDHHVIAQRMLQDRYGQPVILSSTGTKFQKIGMLVLSPKEGNTKGLKGTSTLLSTDSLLNVGCVNTAVRDTLEAITAEYNELGNHVVASTAYFLEAVDNARDLRVVRLRETNLGNLVSDAFREVAQADIGWSNGGAIRQNLTAPAITRTNLLELMPFLNNVRKVSVTGEDLLNALETGVKGWPVAEGGFPQVSGLRFQFDSTIASTVVLDSNGMFSHVKGGRRISHVEVLVDGQYRPIDLKARYTVASTDYVLLFGGDGITFPSAQVLPLPDGLPSNLVDIDLMEYYLIHNLKGQIPARYAKPQGRIVWK